MKISALLFLRRSIRQLSGKKSLLNTISHWPQNKTKIINININKSNFKNVEILIQLKSGVLDKKHIIK